MSDHVEYTHDEQCSRSRRKLTTVSSHYFDLFVRLLVRRGWGIKLRKLCLGFEVVDMEQQLFSYCVCFQKVFCSVVR